MKITSLKATVAKVFTVGLLAGAVAMAAPQKADAQVRFGVRIGGPVYVGPAYRPYGYVAPAPYVYGGYYGPRRFYYDRWHHGYWR
jgi:hypothetical protein